MTPRGPFQPPPFCDSVLLPDLYFIVNSSNVPKVTKLLVKASLPWLQTPQPTTGQRQAACHPLMKEPYPDGTFLCKTTSKGKGHLGEGNLSYLQTRFKKIINPQRTLITVSHPAADQLSNRLARTAKNVLLHTQNKRGNQLLQTNLLKFIGRDAHQQNQSLEPVKNL